MSQNRQTWEVPNPTLLERAVLALSRSYGALPASLSAALLVRFLHFVTADGQPRFFTPEFIVFTLAFTLLCWGALFTFCFVSTWRALADRLFTVAGFSATFFGLLVLAVFFIGLAEEVGKWMALTPNLIEEQNEKYRALLADLKSTEKELRDRLEEAEKSLAGFLAEAKTEEEKKEVRELFEHGLPKQRAALKKTEAEIKIIAENSIREDTSLPGVFLVFLKNGPSNVNAPQDAGIGPALWGSIFLGLITILFSVPVGIGAALYLEEYRQEGWLAKVIQLNINNLAGVPSVVYGILGGFVFVWIFLKIDHPDIAPRNLLGGGLTLGLLTLPMVIVSAQEAIRAVPNSLRQGAYALGATKWQVMWTIVLPMARPGILTGTILSLSRAVGEAAPLVLFGAQLYVDQNPTLFSRFTALPMQIFHWCGLPRFTPEDGSESIDIWKYNAAVASAVLLIVLLGMNAVAIFWRNRTQRKMRY